MDPVQQTLAQQTSGSAEGQGFGQYFVQGQQTSLSKRKLDLEEQQQQFDQERQSMLLPLQMQALGLHNTNVGIEVATNVEKWHALTQQNALLPEIFKLQAAFAQSPQGYGDQNLINQAEELASKKPTAFAAGPGAELLTNIRAIPMMRQKFDEVRRFNKDLSGTGQMVSEITDKGGIRLERATGANTPAGMQEFQLVETLRRASETATDPAQKAEFEKQYANALTMFGKSPSAQTVYDKDGNKIFESTTGKQPNSVPTGVKTKLEETTNNVTTLLQSGNDLIHLAQDPNNVGIRGNLIRNFNSIAPNLGVPPIEGGKQFELKSAAVFFGQNVIRQIKSDGQISQREVSKLEQAVADGGWLESTKSITDQTSYLSGLLALSQVLRLARNGQTVPLDLLRRLPDDTVHKAIAEHALDSDGIRALYNTGKLSETEAIAAIQQLQTKKK
jgi:hypothetical protein